ncbi:MAG: surfeit locus 1 family protein, partial [Candidatus Azotimanducaceae bacterium]
MARRFLVGPRITVFSVICLSGFISLGFWQLDREVEKGRLIAEELEQDSAAAIVISELDSNPRTGRRVKLNGNFDPDVVLLLDNRVLNGKVGFEVHQLFHDKSGLSALVNRGFVQMGRTRSDLPVIPELPMGEVQIEGRIHYPSEPYLLPAIDLAYETFPLIVQYPDVARLAKLLDDTTLALFVVRSGENAP